MPGCLQLEGRSSCGRSGPGNCLTLGTQPSPKGILKGFGRSWSEQWSVLTCHVRQTRTEHDGVRQPIDEHSADGSKCLDERFQCLSPWLMSLTSPQTFETYHLWSSILGGELLKFKTQS